MRIVGLRSLTLFPLVYTSGDIPSLRIIQMKKCALNHVLKLYVVQISSDSAEDDVYYKRKEVFF